MQLVQLIESLRARKGFGDRIVSSTTIPAQNGLFKDYPSCLNPFVVRTLEEMGIERLYSHQREAMDHIADGRNVVVVTPTASGKTLCYNAPVLSAITDDEKTRALYLFPTKALSQDQVAELNSIVEKLESSIRAYTYDGDTPKDARRSIRTRGQVVVTNPDMLHTGILPHHTKWNELFSNLKYVVVDELHMYRGVFGSHFANLIRRLKRICRFYGSDPEFICCSATIGNPRELAEELFEENFVLVDKSGAPRGEKTLIFYNPPVMNRQLGIRKSLLLETRDVALRFMEAGIVTIVFARSRLSTEVLVRYLKEEIGRGGKDPGKVRGYRGGYLPLERRDIEKALRKGELLGVVSTNALELGIDIGSLEACVMAGYPGTISSTWQQAGRAGRKTEASCAVLVASSSPLDQFIVGNPDYFFGRTPEKGAVDPDNLHVLVSHVKCGAFELPFRKGESFGKKDISEVLTFLEDKSVVHLAAGKYHWMSDSYPAESISLRCASPENFVVFDASQENLAIGEVDLESGPMLLHEDAIYIHEGKQYHIEKLDWEGKKAYAQPVDVDYYTDAKVDTDIQVMDSFVRKESDDVTRFDGEIAVKTLPTMYKKVRLHTHENIGSGEIHLPELDMHTTSYWISFQPGFQERLINADLKEALLPIANVVRNIVPVFLLCDPRDIRAVHQEKSPFTDNPTVFVYDDHPGGVGLSERIYELDEQIFMASAKLIEQCPCAAGCPSCVGPIDEVGPRGKEAALQTLRLILQEFRQGEGAETG
jgi:DEAD/DEAH box helicase domain-containing protein